MLRIATKAATLTVSGDQADLDQAQR